MTTGGTRWWWVRHAPVAGPPGVVLGQAEAPADLNDEAAFAALRAVLPPDAVPIATPLSRTRDTAAHLSERPLTLEPAFLEQRFGRWQGLTHAEIAARDPEACARFWTDPAAERPPEGESFADLMARVEPAIRRLSTQCAGRDVVAVAHAGTIRAALALALDLSPAVALRFRVDPLSLTRIDIFAEGAAAVGCVNRPFGTSTPPPG